MSQGLHVIALTLALAAGAPAAASVEDQPRHYGATAPVTVSGTEGLQRVELPLAVLQASRSPELADLRLFDAAGKALPLAWAGVPPMVPATERSVALPRFAWPAAPTERHRDGGSSIQINAAGAVVRIQGARVAAEPKGLPPTRWLLDASAAPRKDGERWHRVVLDWPRRDDGLATTVRVEASDDARQWRAVTQTALLELAGASDAPAQKYIAWPSSGGQPNYVRLNFDVPMQLTGSALVSSAEPAEAALASQSVAFVAGSQASTWALDLQGRVPLSRLQVHLPTPNIVVALRLEQRQDETQAWQAVASYVAWRLVRDGAESVAPPLTFHAAPARHWRLVADARTPLPALASIDATVSWRAPMLVFAAREGQGLRLAVGREKTVSSALPLATLMPGYRHADEFKLPLARVGPLLAQSVATPGLPERLREASHEDKRRWLLWGVLALAVVGLGVLALRLARDVNRPPAP